MDHKTNQPIVTDETKPKRTRKSFVVFLVLILMLGTGFGVYAWQQKKIDTIQSDYNSTVVAPVKKTKQPKENKVPADFVKYENKDIGLSFAYPSSWGQVSYANEKGYINGSFSKNKDVIFGGPTTEYTTMGRGGMPQDTPAYTQVNKEFYYISVYKTDEGPSTNLSKLPSSRVATEKEGFNTKVLVADQPLDDFIGYAYREVVINLNKDQPVYGIKIVLKNPTNASREELDKLITTIEIL